MKRIKGLACAALLAMASVSNAQLKPSSPDTPSLPPSAAEEQQKEAQAFKELAARVAAERWVALIDAGEYGKAWDQCARVFREKVARAQWVEGLPKSRGALGSMKSRKVEVSSFKTSLPGMPNGEYVTVRFATSFEKRGEAQEIVTLIHEDGVWRPLGYGIG